MKNWNSFELFEKAKNIIPGGVNSPVRAFKSVGLNPPFIKRAKGSRIIDEDGNEFIDYVCSWGPAILGHAHEAVIEEIKRAAEDGTSYGAPTRRELELAEIICDALPSVEMVRMVNSGTEAVMSAVRIARGFTGRDMIMKFDGCYHGHSDGLLVKAGSGALTSGIPDSAGVPLDYARNTITAQYNEIDSIREVFKNYGSKLAAVIVEPVAANMGVIVPEIEFLKVLRELCDTYGVILIFDEVITGFRISFNGAQGYYGIVPDLTVLGKIIGGGMPVGAYGGKKEIMSLVSPSGPVYQAGTLSGNPIAMAAGLKTLQILRDSLFLYKELENKAALLEEAFLTAACNYNIPIALNRVGSIMSVFFTGEKVKGYKTALGSDVNRFAKFFSKMLDSGIYIAPSQFEAIFVSCAHNDEDIGITTKCIDAAFSTLL